MTVVIVFMTTIDCNDENFVDFGGEKGMSMSIQLGMWVK